MQILRGYKFKLKLNKNQEKILNSWIGANRCLYNLAVLQRSMTNYREHKIGYDEQAAELPALKKEFPWMKEPPAQTLQQTLMNVQNAFLRFYKGLGSYPRTKKKSHSAGIRFPSPGSIQFRGLCGEEACGLEVTSLVLAAGLQSRSFANTLKNKRGPNNLQGGGSGKNFHSRLLV